jgi:hypothetical protein
VNWPAWDPAKAEGIGFIGYLNALLPFMPTVPSESALMARFSRIGIGPGRHFDPQRLDPATRNAIEEGIAAAAANLRRKALAQNSSKGFFGTREELGSDYLTYRAMGAMLGIYGNSSIRSPLCKPADRTRWPGARRSPPLGAALSRQPATASE